MEIGENLALAIIGVCAIGCIAFVFYKAMKDGN